MGINDAVIKDADLVNTECIFCGDSSGEVVYPPRLPDGNFSAYTFSARRERKREHYRIVLCQKCGLVRSNPVLREDALNSFYRESELLMASETDLAAKTYSSLMNALLKKHATDKKPASLLEIGCSNGSFLEMAMESGMPDVLGFEPGARCIENAKDTVKGKIISDVFKPELLDGRAFDMACAFHVFDHLMHPKETLSDILKHLNTGGYVFIVCHDVESWSAKLFGSFSPIFDVEHIYLFSKTTLTRLLEDCGLRVLEAGQLANTYPLGYWLGMLPFIGKLAGLMPSFMLNMPVKIKAGNLYAFGRKER